MAERLLKDHGQEGRFDVWIDTSHDLDLIAQRVKEFGCTVEVNPSKRIIQVEAPKPN